MNTFPTSPQTSSRFRLTVLCIGGALLTYMSMYAFRKPLSAATFEGLSYWGIDYKVIALICQVIGYTCSKFLGIKVVSEMQPGQRIRYILGLVGIAWVALLGFAVVPHPYNLPFLVVNGLPLGMIFGIVISFLEGRRNTELLGAGLCISFITASGITKAVGKFLVVHFHISEFWMPFAVGGIFVRSYCWVSVCSTASPRPAKPTRHCATSGHRWTVPSAGVFSTRSGSACCCPPLSTRR